MDKMTIEVWEEYQDDEKLVWVSYYPPLDLYSQGNTKEEAIEGARRVIITWTRVASERMVVKHVADRVWRTGVHNFPPKEEK